MHQLEDVTRLLDKMVEDVCAHLGKEVCENALMVGIHTGGVWVAERLHARMKLKGPLGKLNIAFYRDDFSRIGLHPAVTASALPFNSDGRHIILVDDVLYTGRTIRAALNELFDYGRPACVTLAVLVDRGGRELPVQADIVGQRLNLSASEQVKLSGPEPLKLSIQTVNTPSLFEKEEPGKSPTPAGDREFLPLRKGE
ncbi:MAG: bifunctional pyr operon transcriptional regulator/uracil phosphoribosyltransferase PyrR [Gammaproteobacteria bacterium]|nr:bifunctional pyr operon transcriptional regulator/uracil phosphoribosyltransferase PyrR [Gammaproteobacteria bacterium]